MVGTLVVVAVRLKRVELYKRFAWFRGLYRIDRDWFLYFPLVIGMFGAIGLIPDILYVTGIMEKAATRSDFFNIFFFHSWLEKIEDLPEYRQLDRVFNWIGEVFLYSLSIGILFFYIRLGRQIVAGKKKR